MSLWPVGRSATVSPCARYRYDLERNWDDEGPPVVWIMLNPSTADELSDDPTIRRVMGFSRAWGYGRAVVVNLFALRATDPHVLLNAADPVGPENDATLRRWAGIDPGYEVIAAWGAVPRRLLPRVTAVHLLTGRRFSCLGETKDGQPRHPLYVRGDTLLRPFGADS